MSRFLSPIRIAGVFLLAVLASRGVCLGEEPEGVLKERDLIKSGNYVLQAAEKDFVKQATELLRFRRLMFQANANLEKYEKLVDLSRQKIILMMQQRLKLRAQLQRTSNVTQANQIVSAINSLGDQIILLEKQGDESPQLREARDGYNKARQEYMDHILAMRREHDRIAEKYADLAADPSVKQAIDELAKAEGKPLKLGPSISMRRQASTLKKCEDTILTEDIPLRKDEFDVLWVTASFGSSKHVGELAVASGASIVVLPEEFASKMGITASPSDPDIRFQLADGNLAEGKQVFIRSLSIGKFTLEDVEAAVMPARYVGVDPCLGQSFLRHFSYKVDSATKKLSMAKIDDGKK